MAFTNNDTLSIIRSLLNVMDNLERALTAASDPAGGNSDAVREGIRGIHRQLTDLLYEHKVRSFSTFAMAFDPSRHEAMGQTSSDTVPPNHVAEEIRRGYLLDGELLRAAQVLVNTGVTEIEQPAKAVQPPAIEEPPSPVKPPAGRSAESRPSWLMNPPEATSEFRYFVALKRNAMSLDAGKTEASDELVTEILLDCAKEWDESPVTAIYERAGKMLSGRVPKDTWKHLIDLYPRAENWIEDIFWERKKSEIDGASTDVAILAAAPINELMEMAEISLDGERWGGITFNNLSPLLKVILPEPDGSVVVDVKRISKGGRQGIRAGDIITRVGSRSVVDGPTARRLFTLHANSKRPFDVTLSGVLEGPRKIRFQNLNGK